MDLLDNKYMTRKEVCGYLQINDNYSEATINDLMSKIITYFRLNHVKQKVDGCITTVYYKDEIIKIANDVLDFFDKHYTKNVAEKKLGVRINNRFEPINIPDGYTIIMKTNTGCGLDKIAYKKHIIDSHCKIKYKIEQGYYISRKDAMALMKISEKPFNRIKKELDEISFNQKYYYNKEKVESMIGCTIKKSNIETRKKMPNKPQGFISKNEVMDILRIDSTKSQKASINTWMRTFVEGFNIEVVSVNSHLFYKESNVIDAIEEVNNFRDIYYSKEETCEILSISYSIDIGKVEVPSHYGMVLKLDESGKSSWKTAFKKDDINEYVQNLNTLQSKIESGEYISLKESRELLDISTSVMNEIRDKYEIDEFKYLTGLYFNQEQVLALKNKCKEFFKEYITIKDAKKVYFDGNENTIYNYPEYLNKYEAPLFTYTKDYTNSISQAEGKVLKISEVKYLKDNLENIRREEVRKKEDTGNSGKGSKKSYINYNLEGETYRETFYLRLYEKWDGFSDKSPYTKKKWLEFIENKIETMRADKKVSNYRVNSFIACTRELDNMLRKFNVSEVYELTSNNINTCFNLMNNNKQHEIFYEFLTKVSNDVEYVLKKKGSKKRGFRIEDIFSPYKAESRERKLTPYGFEIYSKLFQYTIDLDLHIKKSIDEILEQNTAIYVSTWLYSILHINNAWRHGDVTRFPRLELRDILIQNGINDYLWFKQNEISLETSQLIISKVIQWEFVISKTGANGTFFCSDELAPAFASSVIILFLYHEKNGHIYNPEQELNTALMEFSTKYNQPSEKNINDYFEKIDIEDFKFSSLRMNKTIMTLIYYLANLGGDSKALVYAQKLRGQLDQNSPLDYIEINMEDFDSLTRHLFARGEFGYITSLLVSRLQSSNEGTITFENMTEQIMQVNGLFGELSGLYNTIGFLNSVKHERQLIIDTLAEKSLKECQIILTKIFTHKLPSRMQNVQCLISNEGCYKTASDEDEVDCFDCPYHIPSIYALTTLCESIVHDLKKYKTASRIKQFKLSLSIDRKIMLIKEAIAKYGEDCVYNCIGIDRETFINMIDIVDLPEDFEDLIVWEG